LIAGIQFRNLVYSFRISEIPVAVVVVQVCKAVCSKLKKPHVPEPKVPHFERIAEGTRDSLTVVSGVKKLNTQE
jgi:hypothetical protein